MARKGPAEATIAVRRGQGRGRVFKLAISQLTPLERAEWDQQQAGQKRLFDEAKRDRERAEERRRKHPIRDHVLDALFGLPIVVGVVTLFLSYLGVIRW